MERLDFRKKKLCYEEIFGMKQNETVTRNINSLDGELYNIKRLIDSP